LVGVSPVFLKITAFSEGMADVRFFITNGGLTGATLTLHQAAPSSASPPTNPLEAVAEQSSCKLCCYLQQLSTLEEDYVEMTLFPAQMAIEGRPLLPKKRHFTPMFCLIFN
jgi:hypothetical protein